jgi:hypothetical protein
MHFQASLAAPNVPDRDLTIIVARVWPPRKRDFLEPCRTDQA